LNFKTTIVQLGEQQSKITSEIKNNEQLLAKVSGGFAENMEVIRNNFDAIQQRIDRISEKLNV